MTKASSHVRTDHLGPHNRLAHVRSLALPFSVKAVPSKHLVSSSEGVAASADSTSVGSDEWHEETVESFAFALVNGALGVIEVQGRRIRDFRFHHNLIDPADQNGLLLHFVPSDGLVTAMAYRLPHVVMGDRSGNIRWWDETTGQSSAFNSHRDGIRRIKFSPVVAGDRSRGRVAVLFTRSASPVTSAVSDSDLSSGG